MQKTRLPRLRLTLIVLVLAIIGCSENDQRELDKISKMLEQTAAAGGQDILETAAQGGKDIAATAADTAKETLQAKAKTQVWTLATDIFETEPSPWDISWLPTDLGLADQRINEIIEDTGMDNQGEIILQYALQYGINPAFALAMFYKEATFARPGTRAYTNNNPGNIIATSDCRGQSAGTSCKGAYGEINTDGRFGIYASMADGIRAYFLLLTNEYAPGTRRNCRDIRCIIQVYCPPSDCDTDQYIDQVILWTRDYQAEIIRP